MIAPGGRSQDEEGTTLLELLMAMMIFGIAGLMVVGGFLTASLVSETGAGLASVEAATRSAAESVKSAPYDTGCPASYTAAAPPDFTASVVSVQNYRASQRSLASPAATCEPEDTQVITIEVTGSTSTGPVVGTVDVVKRP